LPKLVSLELAMETVVLVLLVAAVVAMQIFGGGG
jgi:hypothetical protein